MTPPALGTIVARNYVPFARVLAKSLRDYHPESRLIVVVADAGSDTHARGREPFETLTPEALNVPELDELRFRSTRQELVVALKPFLLAALLEREPSALFVDADVLVLSRLDSLFAAAQEHALTLVPHSLEPPTGSDRIERDLVFNKAGAFNGGIVGVSRRPETNAFLSWWQMRLHRRCTQDVDHGLHFDQRWLDLSPAFVEDLHVHRDPGVNVAHWNLRERPVRILNGTVTAAEALCRLFHFSGFDPDEPEKPTRYRPELRLQEIGDAEHLFRAYARSLDDAGWGETRSLPYAYASFTNGVRIPPPARRLYAELPDRGRFGDPFDATGPHSYFHWLRESPVRRRGLRGPNRLWLFVHRQRPDVQWAFPDPLRADRRRFLSWTRKEGALEHGIPPELV